MAYFDSLERFRNRDWTIRPPLFNGRRNLGAFGDEMWSGMMIGVCIQSGAIQRNSHLLKVDFSNLYCGPEGLSNVHLGTGDLVCSHNEYIRVFNVKTTPCPNFEHNCVSGAPHYECLPTCGKLENFRMTYKYLFADFVLKGIVYMMRFDYVDLTTIGYIENTVGMETSRRYFEFL